MSAPHPSTQQVLLQIAEIASRRQKVREKCQSIEKSDFKCSMHGTERLKAYRRELELMELELESAVKQWEASNEQPLRSVL